MKNLLRIFAFSFVLLSVFSFINTKAFASSDDNMKLYISYIDENSIEIDWSKVEGSSFILRDQNKKIYEGTNKKYLTKNLESGTYVTYELVAFDKFNNILDLYQLKAYTTFQDSELINYSVISNRNEIKLDWNDVVSAIKYEVYLNDNFLYETTKSEVKLSNLPAGKSFDFKIIAYLPNTDIKPDEGVDDSLNKYYEYDFIQFDVKADTLSLKDVPSYYGNSVISSEITTQSFSTLAVTNTPTQIRIRTFIAESCYGAAIPGAGKGDGRGPSPTNGTHRTMVNITTYFDPTAVSSNINIGESVSYSDNDCKTESGRKTASGSPKVKLESFTPSIAYISVKHSVGAPFYLGLLPDIDYDFDIRVYNSGATTLRGKHDGFPDYEVYKKYITDTSWTRLYYWDASANGQGIHSLAPPMEISF